MGWNDVLILDAEYTSFDMDESCEGFFSLFAFA